MQKNDSLPLKVLICQLDSNYKSFTANTSKIESSLSRYTPSDQIDVILFPEMPLIGYHFKDSSDIEPFTEKKGEGPTFEFLSNLAKKVKSYVICGYAEKEEKETIEKGMVTVYYNSAYVIDREGVLILNYRKHHLYEVDERWAEEGDCFMSIQLINAQGNKFKAVIAICMDINCYQFKDPNKFELADFFEKENADALFFLSAWKDSEPESNTGDSIKTMLNYWIYRLSSLMTSEKNKGKGFNKSWAFFCSNRVGKEENTVFSGCSNALKFNPLKFIGCLDKRNQGFLMAEVILERGL